LPGGGTPRTDEYAFNPKQPELGLKKRGVKDGVEVKGLVALRRRCAPPFDGQIQIWCKWTSEALTVDQLQRIAVHKTRWLRKFDTSGADVLEVEVDADERLRKSPGRLLERGCQLELVSLRLDSGPDNWWSLGFEAFGELDDIEDSLRRTALHLASSAPNLGTGIDLSYPQWLAESHSQDWKM
jgi:hypothetical protein